MELQVKIKFRLNSLIHVVRSGVDLPSSRSLSSRRAFRLSLCSCFSISVLIRFCSRASCNQNIYMGFDWEWTKVEKLCQVGWAQTYKLKLASLKQHAILCSAGSVTASWSVGPARRRSKQGWLNYGGNLSSKEANTWLEGLPNHTGVRNTRRSAADEDGGDRRRKWQ